MARTRKEVNVMMDKNIHLKLMFVALSQRELNGNKRVSVSEIVNKALTEYFDNHKEEIESALDVMRKRGWDI